MKKKLRCLFKRFAALVAALMLSFSLPVSALAAGDDAAPMPSFSDFQSHPDSFYVWRSFDAGHLELIGGPLVLNSDGSLIESSSAHHSYSCYLKSFEYSLGDGSYSVFGCAIPSPIRFYYGTLDAYPSFRIDSSNFWYSACLHFYPSSGQDLSNVYCYIVPLYGSADRRLFYSNSDSSSFVSFDAAFFDSPFLSYPFALRSYSGSNSVGFSLVGGIPLFDSYSPSSYLDLHGSRFLSNTLTLSPYPEGYAISSADIGVVFVRKPSGSYITNVNDYSVSVSGAFSFAVPNILLPDVKPGDWLSSADLKKLQDQLVKDFNVNSDTLTNSRDNLNSWNSTSSVDSDIASGAFGLLNGIFQNLGTFLFSVSLLCFGAVVLRMFIRKAVDG